MTPQIDFQLLLFNIDNPCKRHGKLVSTEMKSFLSKLSLCKINWRRKLNKLSELHLKWVVLIDRVSNYKNLGLFFLMLHKNMRCWSLFCCHHFWWQLRSLSSPKEKLTLSKRYPFRNQTSMPGFGELVFWIACWNKYASLA